MRSFSQYCSAMFFNLTSAKQVKDLLGMYEGWCSECESDFAWTLPGGAGKWPQLRDGLKTQLNTAVRAGADAPAIVAIIAESTSGQ